MTRSVGRIVLVGAALVALVPLTVAQIESTDQRSHRRVTSTTAPPTLPSSIAAPTTVEPRCPTRVEPAPALRPELSAAVAAFTTDPRVASNAAGLSIWVDGYGEVGSHEPDRALFPASNQKLLTAIGALGVIGPEARLATEIRRAPTGALVVVGGGDPSLRARGPHSLDELAVQARVAGVTDAAELLVDESRHDTIRRAAGWQDWQVPAYAGPLSAFMVDGNRWRGDPAFLADPALANAERLREALARVGVTVRGPTRYGKPPPASSVVARIESVPVSALVFDMVMRSDNMAAEELLKEIGRRGVGLGSTAAGATAARTVVTDLCVPLRGADDDGSGLSRGDGRSAREWVSILRAIRAEPWFPVLFDALPVAGRSGTLSSRFRGTAAAERVHAKTGTIIGGVALSGYGTTVSGRWFVFSVLVNGDTANGAVNAVDRLVATVAGHTG